jgi:filamentous hemagglutinin family protein
MNQRCFRVIFNRARGQAIVVGELVRTPGHVSSAGSVPARSLWRRCTLPLVLTLILGWMPGAEATIVADANAPSSQQPSVVTAPNGASPLVNIQTPNAAGISHNTYSRFDVEPAGAILNNSRQAVHTQLAGTIAGNPHLTTGPAQVILNEVNSSNPSLLRGFIEVAGQRAHVVVANPSGIYVKGSGFINTSGVTLTTGTPQWQNGHLDSYRVTGGLIKIDGEGLDIRTADYTQIFAQAVQLNAAVHAKKLRVTTGNNLVKVDNSQATPIASSTEAPEFALDVAKLGGMYAHHIFIVGTENGVGMRNSGIVQASAGPLIIDNQGFLSNRGLIDSKTNTVRATTLNNLGHGRLYGNQLAIGVTTLNNDQEQVNGVTAAAVIGGRQSLALGAQHINNRHHAKIISTGTLSIGGTLDRQQQIKGQAVQFNNESASLEAHGNANLKIDTLNNRDVYFTTREVPLSTAYRREMQRDGDPVKVPINDHTLRQFTDLNYTVYDYSRTLTQTEIVQRDPAQLLFGGKVRLSGTLYNDNSQLILGGTLLGPTKTIHNIDTFGTRATIEQTTAQHTTTGWTQDAHQGRCFKRLWGEPVTSQKTLQQQTILLKGVREQRPPGAASPAVPMSS